MHQKNEKTTLYVAGPPSSWVKTDFEQLFAPFGVITESKILVDNMGVSRGVGFITLDSVAGATAALSLNGQQPVGCEKPIQVKFAEHSISEGRKLNAQKTQMANMMFGMGGPGMMGMGMPGGLKPGMYGKAPMQGRPLGGMVASASPYARPASAGVSMSAPLAPAMMMMGNPFEPFNAFAARTILRSVDLQFPLTSSCISFSPLVSMFLLCMHDLANFVLFFL